METCSINIYDSGFAAGLVSYFPTDQEVNKFPIEGYAVDFKENYLYVGKYQIFGSYKIKFTLNIKLLNENEIMVNGIKYIKEWQDNAEL